LIDKPKININRIKKLVHQDRLILSYHCRQRAFERRISTDQIKNAILADDILETFNDEKPCPRAHVSGKVEGVVHHVILAQCKDNITIVTVYIGEDIN
jgi:hypothetical protein